MIDLLAAERQPAPGLWETPFSARLIAQARRIELPRLSPDGRWLAYVESYNGRSDLWIMPSGGGRARLISGDAPCVPGQDNAPFSGGYGAWYCWTPDGSALIYTGSTDAQLYRVPRDGGRAERLTDDPGRHLNPRVTPDGAAVVCVVDRGDLDDQIFIGLYDLRGHRPSMRRLTPGHVVALDPVPSPDGRRLACVLYALRDRWAHHSQLAAIDLQSDAISVLTPTDNVVNVRPRWSPDGATIAFLSDRSGWLNLWTMPVASGEPRPAMPEAVEQIDFAWSPDGRRLAVLRNEAAEIGIAILDLATGETRALSTERDFHRELSWAGGAIAALHHSPQQPPNVVVFDPESGASRQMTDAAIGGLADPALFVMPEHVSWPSADGLEIPGLLFTPARTVPAAHPVLVHVHGGPTGQSMVVWDPVIQYFVSRGWVVMQPNYRGSTGYGRGFADRLHGVWGVRDLEDNAASIGVPRARGLVDERRLVVWGGSAGGYATLASMAMTPGVYAAGIDLYGIADWTTMREDSDRYARYLADTEFAPAADGFDLWVERSPISHVDRVAGPLMIFQGTADPRVPPSQSEAMVAALRRAGKTVSYQTYEGESHGWRTCATIEDYIMRMESFLIRHVLTR